jgi:hypothetical protein
MIPRGVFVTLWGLIAKNNAHGNLDQYFYIYSLDHMRHFKQLRAGGTWQIDPTKRFDDLHRQLWLFYSDESSPAICSLLRYQLLRA